MRKNKLVQKKTKYLFIEDEYITYFYSISPVVNKDAVVMPIERTLSAVISLDTESALITITDYTLMDMLSEVGGLAGTLTFILNFLSKRIETVFLKHSINQKIFTVP